MCDLAGKRVLLGVTGGIAAYKAAELVRRLRDHGAEVRVVMTEAAQSFVGPLTFQALSGHPVRSSLFDPAHEAAMGHIELARWPDAVLVAPASADFLARLAHGLADDLLSTLCLATAAPILVAPAMNRVMWAAPATRDNASLLERRGIRLVGPAEGEQACGESGAGRLVEPASLVAELKALFGPRPLAGLRALVTAGPTLEPVDPVRYLGNRSSGKMGYAMARALADAGAEVVLVSGPVALAPPAGITTVAVETARQMEAAVAGEMFDLFVGTAAVADFRPTAEADHKVKKGEVGERWQVELERNPDIIAGVAQRRPRPFVVGFAAETVDPVAEARRKLTDKALDLVAANRVGPDAEGDFGSDRNALTCVWADGQRELPLQDKPALARQLVALIAERFKRSAG